MSLGALLGFAQSTDKKLDALTKQLADALAANAAASDALDDGKEAIKALTDENATLKLKIKEFEAQGVAHIQALADKESDVERRAGLKAIEITARQGQPPIKDEGTKSDKLNTVEALRVKLSATTDPAEKYRLTQEIKKALGQQN